MTVKTIKTEEIKIKVLSSVPIEKEELKISRPDEEVKDINIKGSALNYLQGSLLLLAGFVLGLIAAMIPWNRLLKRENTKHTVLAKESKEVLQLLMSHMKIGRAHV